MTLFLSSIGFVAPTWLRPEILSFSLLCIPRPGRPISNQSSRGAWVLFLARNIESCCHFICSLAQGSVVFVFGCSSFHSWWSSPLPSDPIVCSLSRSLSPSLVKYHMRPIFWYLWLYVYRKSLNRTILYEQNWLPAAKSCLKETENWRAFRTTKAVPYLNAWVHRSGCGEKKEEKELYCRRQKLLQIRAQLLCL